MINYVNYNAPTTALNSANFGKILAPAIRASCSLRSRWTSEGNHDAPFSALELVVAAVMAATPSAQTPLAALVGQDPGATKYSTLDQINTGNVKSLQQAWTFHTGDKSGFFESTPLVVDGTMYFTAQNGVYALDRRRPARRRGSSSPTAARAAA